MINRQAIVFILIFFTASVRGNDISILLLNDSLLTAQPGQVMTVAAKLLNNSNDDSEIKTKIEVPPSWKIINSGNDLLLKSNEARVTVFSFYVPIDAPAKKHTVSFNALDATSSKLLAVKTFIVKVPEQAKITLNAVTAPKFLLAGDEINAKFVVKNAGNTTQTIHIETYKCVLKGKSSFTLAPNRTKTLEVTAMTLPEINTKILYSFRVVAKIKGIENATVHANQLVRVIPNGNHKDDAVQSFPAHVRLIYLARNNVKDEFVSGYQAEVFAKGNISDSGDDNFELRLRGPDRFHLSTLGLYEEYYGYYGNKNFSIALGDKNYELTPLMEYSRYGRGIEGKVYIKKMCAGVFYQEPRFYSGITKGMAGFMEYAFSDKHQLSINYLRNTYSTDKRTANLFSIMGHFELTDKTRLEAEISKGIRNGRKGTGVYLQFYSKQIHRLSVASTLIFAGKYYPGYFSNTRKIAVNANYNATDKWNFSISANQDEKNTAQDTLFGIAPLSDRYQAGVTYRLAKNTKLSAYAGKYELMDRMPLLKFHHRGRLLKIQFQKRKNNLFFSLTGEAGKTENLLRASDNRESNTYRGYFDGTYKISSRYNLRSFVSFLHQNIYLEEKPQQWIYGASIHALFFKSTKLDLYFQNNYTLDEYYRDRSLFELSIRQRIKNRHEFSITSRYALLQGFAHKKDFAINVNYTWFPNIHLNKKQNKGNLNGRITSRTKGALSDILLTLNGQTVATDTGGNFQFKNINSGEYYLMLDKSSIAATEISSKAMPVVVKISPGNTPFVSFSLLEAASLSGKVIAEKTTLHRYVVEITHDDETYRILTEIDGTFEFSGLRPGRWTARILKGGLQKNQYFKREYFEITLSEGKTKDINFVLKEKKKQIHFSDKNFIISSKSK